MTDKEIMQWLYERMINVHNEKENYDYMIRFKKVIEGINNE